MSVPVLSVAIVVIEPKLSTAGNFLTIAFRLAILCVPKANANVITIASPSGIAATAKLTAIIKKCINESLNVSVEGRVKTP